jgi:hypothetical protein
VIAADQPSARFSFIGADTMMPGGSQSSVSETLRSAIPQPLLPRFEFYPPVARALLRAHRAKARIAVVPSRWENFPYACMEAMASGLPVLVSPNGGMIEMIEDGRTGWIADRGDAAGFEAALRRALAVSPSDLADMGSAAAARIRSLCDDDAIVGRQLEFRRGVVTRGARLDLPAPPVQSSTDQPHAGSGDSPAFLAQTMTLSDIVRAPRSVQAAVLRRAWNDPGYVARWSVWHLKRLANRGRSD